MSRLSILGMMGRFCCFSRLKEFEKNKKIDMAVRMVTRILGACLYIFITEI